MKTNRGAGAKLMAGQDQARQPLALRRRDVQQIESRLRQPNQLILPWVIESPRKEFKCRIENDRKENSTYKAKGKPKKGEGTYEWKYGESSRYNTRKGPAAKATEGKSTGKAPRAGRRGKSRSKPWRENDDRGAK